MMQEKNKENIEEKKDRSNSAVNRQNRTPSQVGDDKLRQHSVRSASAHNDHHESQLLVNDDSQSDNDDSGMQEEEIDEFCETSSWETESGDDDLADVDKASKNKRNLSHSSAGEDGSSFRTDGSDIDSEKMSQCGWEVKEEANYKTEKRNYREYLER